MDKKQLIALITATICSTCFGAIFEQYPQISLAFGNNRLTNQGGSFEGNNLNIGYTFNPMSRLQLGLKYDSTRKINSDKTLAGEAGYFFTTKLMLNTISKKSPYLGFNLGRVDCTLDTHKNIYNKPWVESGEAVLGYSFRSSEFSRLNLEYYQKYIELNLPEISVQHSIGWRLGWSLILAPQAFTKKEDNVSKEDNLTTKKAYLQNRVRYNEQRIEKFDILIDKYNYRIMQNSENEQLKNEREFLLEQRRELEQQNLDMWKLLEL